MFDPKTTDSKNESAVHHDTGKPRWDLLPWDAMEELVKVYSVGAKKYDDNNWLKGMSWSRCVGSMFRHMSKWLRGQDYDDETGCHHLAHVIWNAMTLLTYSLRKIGKDDRIILEDKKGTVQ